MAVRHDAPGSTAATQPAQTPATPPGWRRAQIALIVGAVLLTLPGVLLRLTGAHPDPRLAAFVFGLSVVGSAFLLAWAAEVAQRDIPRALSLTILAFVAVLPEYAVDAYLAWRAAGDPTQYGPLALVNMTGANRLLIGVAWPMVVLIYCLRARKMGRPAGGVPIESEQGIEVGFLTLATLYSFVIPLKGTLSLVDLVVLVTIFGFYCVRVMKSGHVEPDLIGPAKLLGGLSRTPRRLVIGLLFLVAALVILLVAEPFAESLIEAGVTLGLDRRTLVQWLAPLASEAPEFIITGLFAWRLLGAASLGALVSSKVNQWTLLVSTIPLVFNIASWRLGKTVPAALVLDRVQREDLLLTSAQSLFAVAVLLGLHLSWRNALALFGLFIVQFFLPDSQRWVMMAYFALSALFFLRNLPQITALLRQLLDSGGKEAPPARGH